VLCPRAPVGVVHATDILGHLKHHIRLKRPQELWMMVCEVPLDGVEELLIGSTNELRPALALGRPSPFADRCHLA
jgi:hypothetical protein